MAKKAEIEKPNTKISDKPVKLGAILSRAPIFQGFDMWIVGDTPLICHAWSTKAKLEMLAKQVKATKAGKEARDPQQDFVDSLYEMEGGRYGFPVTGVKNCILSAAHKDKGIARSGVLQALFLNAEMVRCRPALAGAVCDMPLVTICVVRGLLSEGTAGGVLLVAYRQLPVLIGEVRQARTGMDRLSQSKLVKARSGEAGIA